MAHRLAGWSPWLFPLAVWAVATLFFGGDLGKLTDDHTQSRTSEIAFAGDRDLPIWPWEIEPYFYRPLYHLLVHNLGTAVSEHFWLANVVTALAYGLLVALLWRLLWELTGSARSSAAASVLFLVAPHHHEVALWTSAIPTALAPATFLGLCLLVLRVARRGSGTGPLVLVPVLAFLVPCWNEQAAAGVLLLPWVYLAGRRGAGEEDGGSLRRAALPTGMALAAVGLYVLLMQVTAPATVRGGSATMIGANEVVPQLTEGWLRVASRAYGPELWRFVLGGLAHGAAALGSLEGLAWIAALAASAVPFALFWVRRGRMPPPGGRSIEASRGRAALALMLVLGFGLFFVGWLPLFVVRDVQVAPRTFLFPHIGLAVVAAAMLNELLHAARYRRWRGRLTAAVLVLVLCAGGLGSVYFVGVQQLRRDRHHLDSSVLAQLRELVPVPPPSAVFVPLELRATPARTGWREFDTGLLGALDTPWSARQVITSTYGRSDVHSLPKHAATRPSLSHADANGVVCRGAMPGTAPRLEPHESGGWWIPWDRIVPFLVDEDGVVRIPAALFVERPGRQGMEVQPAIARELPPEAVAPRFVLRDVAPGPAR